MDKSIAPGDDFYGYANGGWMKSTEIPADLPATAPSVVLAQQARQDTRAIVEGAANDAKASGGDEKKIGDYYAAFMDEAGSRPYRAGQARARRFHRRHRRCERAGQGARRRTARRRRSAQRHQLLHRPPVRPVGVAGHQRTHAHRALPRAGWPGHPTAASTRRRAAWPTLAQGPARAIVAGCAGLAGIADVDAMAAGASSRWKPRIASGSNATQEENQRRAEGRERVKRGRLRRHRPGARPGQR